MKKSEFRALIREEIKKVLHEEASPVYDEKEAIKMILDPGNKIESKLNGINGYENIELGGPLSASGLGSVYIYFTNKKAAIYGAAVLSNLVPGPEYEKMIKVGNGYAVIEIQA